MPEIDVSDLLTDPTIAGIQFGVVRRQEIVNDFGESVVTDFVSNATGSVIPTGDNSLVRQEAYDAQAKSIQVITTFRLRGASKDATGNFKPDVVMWPLVDGDWYIVRTVEDYSQYGAGMIVAECTSIDWLDFAPAEPANG